MSWKHYQKTAARCTQTDFIPCGLPENINASNALPRLVRVVKLSAGKVAAMRPVYPDLEWYSAFSERKGLPGRCPFAAVGTYDSLAPAEVVARTTAR